MKNGNKVPSHRHIGLWRHIFGYNSAIARRCSLIHSPLVSHQYVYGVLISHWNTLSWLFTICRQCYGVINYYCFEGKMLFRRAPCHCGRSFFPIKIFFGNKLFYNKLCSPLWKVKSFYSLLKTSLNNVSRES